MPDFHRYALYVAPEPGPLATFAAQWLGWDPVTASAQPHPAITGLPAPIATLTDAPRKYGFHATIKPPFRLAQGQTPASLHAGIAALAQTLPPVTLAGLALTNLDGFLALTPVGDVTALTAFAARVVAALDPFRAPLTPADMARRLKSPLSPNQRDLLNRWGYPYVMEEFRFHMTLTGNLAPDIAARTLQALAPHISPLLPHPYPVTSLCLFGEAPDGQFHHLHRYTLSG